MSCRLLVNIPGNVWIDTVDNAYCWGSRNNLVRSHLRDVLDIERLTSFRTLDASLIGMLATIRSPGDSQQEFDLDTLSFRIIGEVVLVYLLYEI